MSEDEDSSGWQLTESDPGVFTYVYPILAQYFTNEWKERTVNS